MKGKSRTLLRSLAGAVLLLIAMFLWSWFAPIKSGAMPDQLDLGVLAKDAKVEISFRMLTAQNHPLVQFHSHVYRKLPSSLRQVWRHLDPRPLLAPDKIIDLKTLNPNVTGPEFLRIEKIEPNHQPKWYNGHPFVDVYLTLDTSRTGAFSGELRATLDRRNSSAPIRFEVRDKSTLPRLLVITPFSHDATESGTNFDAIVKMFSGLPAQVDFLNAIPDSLDPYQLVLLSESPLVSITDAQVAACESLLARGGRVILCCNYFFRGTVTGANRLALDADFGVMDVETIDELSSTNLTTDALTANVRLARFHRASPISISGPRAKSLVMAPDGTNSYLAVSRLESGGEIVLLTQSLWWHWADQFATNSDNGVLLRNILVPPGINPALASPPPSGQSPDPRK